MVDGVERIADHIFAGEIGEALDEIVIDARVDIDALDAAAALAGIIEGAVDQILDGMIELGVGAHIGRVLAAELEPDRGEGSRGGALDGAAAGDGAGEIDVVDLAGADQLLGLLMRHDEIVEQPLWQAGAPERLGDTLADQQRLRGVLEDDGVAGEQAWNDGVDRGEIRIVPRRDDHDDADRLARDIAAEPVFRRRGVGLKRLLSQDHHGADALLDAALLAAIADGPAHLPGELHRNVVVHGEQRIEKRQHVAPALSHGNLPPRRQRPARRRDGRGDLGVAGNRPLGIDRAIDRGDDLYDFWHWLLPDTYERSKPRFNSQSVMRRSYSNCSHSAL